MNHFKYDFIRLWRDRVIIIILLLIFFITGISIYNGNHWIEFQRETIRKLEDTREEQYETYIREGTAYDQQHDTIAFDSPNNPFVIYWGLRGYAYKAPAAMGIFSIGQSDLFPYYSMLVGIQKQYLLIEDEIQNPFNQFTGKLDYSFFILYLIPVLIIVLGFDVLSSEKESGVLKLIQTQGISRLRLTYHKLMLRFLLLTAFILISAVFWVFIFERDMLLSGILTPLFMYLFFVILYILFWFSFCFLIQSLGRSSIMNGLILLGSWVVLLFILPTLINRCAVLKHPVPSRNAQALSDREISNSLEKKRPELLRQYLEWHPEHEKKNADTSGRVSWMDWYYEFLAYQIELDKKTRPSESAIRIATASQQWFSDKLRFLSPSLVLDHLLLHLSETGVTQQLDYAYSLDLFNEEWRAFIRDKMFRRIKFSNEDFRRLPKFELIHSYTLFPPTAYIVSTGYLLVFIVLLTTIAIYYFIRSEKNAYA